MEKKNILERLDHNDGMTVPDGFFDRFTQDMIAKLPEQEWEKNEGHQPVILEHRTLWQRVRPYVYMAAMFAGVWLMMNMFSLFSPATPEQSLQENAILAEAFSNEQFVEDLDISAPDEDLEQMIDEMYSAGITVDDLRLVLEDEDKI